MLYAKDFREKAREALSGKWAVAVGTGFVASLLGAYTALDASGGGSSSSSSNWSDASNVMSEPEKLLVGALVLGVFLIVAIILIAYGIISGPISVGYAGFNINLVDNNNPQFSDLFSGMSRFGKNCAMQWLRWIYIFLWSLLFVIPGIIATHAYALAPYLMADDPELGASDAIRESKRLMQGNKWRLFCLNFSFIGWDLLCVFLTLGIGYLWLTPYREAAFAAFYREIKDGKYSNPYIEEESTDPWSSYNF